MLIVDVADQGFELVLSAMGGEVGDLRLEGTDEVGRGIGDGAAEVEDGVAAALEARREFGRVGIEADAEQLVVLRPGGLQGGREIHAAIVAWAAFPRRPAQ